MRSTLALFMLALLGCQSAPADPLPPNVRPVTSVSATVATVQPSAIVREHDVSAFGFVTGVAIEGERTLVLTSQGALYDVASGEQLWQGEPTTDAFGYTDLAAVPGGVAVTSLSEGYLVNVETGAMTPHFCYEPGWWEPEGQDPVQLSLALSHDEAGARLYAQPRTLENGGAGAAIESFIAAYDLQSGEDVLWWTLDVGFVASGMAVLPRDQGDPQLLLASGATLHRFDVATGELAQIADLTALDVTAIEGLALNEEAETLLVIESVSAKLLEIRLDAIGL